MTELVNQHIARCDQPEARVAYPCVVLGTDRIITRQQWDDRQSALLVGRIPAAVPPVPDRPPPHGGPIKVSMIASIYKAGRFIDGFLKNITAQTAFYESELIIIDADSPEREWNIIERYQMLYPNIIYKRIGFRIGIYDAWNMGLELARGLYITNTNVDDLRRSDSIALQAVALEQNPDADIVYQDFFYSFDPQLSFEEVAEIGFRSELPIVTRHNLLGCNSPHNAPMWRKQLHSDVGFFDTRYKSAGDHEFWLRCLVAGKTFQKINTPHVVYFQNPEGMSTKPESPGVLESHDIFNRYSARLTSPALLQSRRGFIARIGLNEVLLSGDTRTYYDVAQDALLRLGRARLCYPPARDCDDYGSAADGSRIIRILIDGICFQARDDEVCQTLRKVLSDVVALSHVAVFVLDRGGCPDIGGAHRIEFPSYYGTYTATDSLLIQQMCDKFKIDVFTSTGLTAAVTTPQLHLVTDVFGAYAGSDHDVRKRKEQYLAVAYSTRFMCWSESAIRSLLATCPKLHPNRITQLFGPAFQEADYLEGEKRGHGASIGDAAESARLCFGWRQVHFEQSGAVAVNFAED